jgi:hypothetical protein
MLTWRVDAGEASGEASASSVEHSDASVASSRKFQRLFVPYLTDS